MAKLDYQRHAWMRRGKSDYDPHLIWEQNCERDREAAEALRIRIEKGKAKKARRLANREARAAACPQTEQATNAPAKAR